jgi:hypothetical protein
MSGRDRSCKRAPERIRTSDLRFREHRSPQDWSATGQTAAYQRDFLLNELGADLGSARLIRSDTFDNWPGQSGSPIFGFWSDGPYAVGVVSGEGDDYNYISGDSLLASIVRRARNDHPYARYASVSVESRPSSASEASDFGRPLYPLA